MVARGERLDRSIAWTVLAACVLSVTQASGCTPSEEGQDGGITFGASTTSVRPPSLLRAVDPATLRPEVEIDDAPGEAFRGDDGIWRVVHEFDSGGGFDGDMSPDDDVSFDDISFVVTWVGAAARGIEPLPLATFRTIVPRPDADRTIRIERGDYSTRVFDRDDDGFSNLAELNAGSDPQDADSVPAEDVLIRRISPEEAPDIDGLYEESTWNQARYSRIDNLMIDNGGAIFDDGEAPYRWGGLHDGDYLYLFVIFDDVDAGHRFGDSEMAWEDDNLNIYLDGNFSRGAEYDGVDDEHVMIRMTSASGAPSQGEIVFSSRSAGRLLVDSAVCHCDDGVDTWEVRIDLGSAGIPADEGLFGIDLQIDQDRDGGDRDAKWGWFHPSGSDTTWTDPSRMGSASLE